MIVFGRLHVLVLHFPIVLLVGLVLLEAWFRLRGRRFPPEASRALVVLAALSAVAAVATGLAYEALETWPEARKAYVERHELLGIVAAVLSVQTVVLHVLAERKGGALRTAYVLSLALAAGTVAAAGHVGGEVVHGGGFLFREAGEGKSWGEAPGE